MAEDIKIVHRGYEIKFNERTEHWYCSDIESLIGSGRRGDEVRSEYLTSEKLAKVKEGIDKFLAEMRKSAGVEAYLISDRGYDAPGPKMTPCMVVEYSGAKRTYNDKQPDHKVATMAIRMNNKKPSRQEGSMAEIMPNTDEAHSAFAVAVAAHKKIQEAEKEFRKAFAAIPRLQLEDIPELVKIHDRVKLGPIEETATEERKDA